MENLDISHEKSIWTLKTGGRISLWFPYLSKIEKNGKKWRFIYNGGELEVDLTSVDFVLFYGANCDIPLSLLDDFNKHNIIAILHRRNIPTPYIFHCSNLVDTKHDVLTKQILYRESELKRNYIAKTLIRERLKSMAWLIDVPDAHYQQLRAAKKMTIIIGYEAQHTKRYWREYAQKLNLSEWQRRDDNDPVSAALDACSFFLSGILLRWILFHKLSPAHAYIHQPTTYTSLVYDLMEPYRYLFEQAVFDCISKEGDLTKNAIARLNELLDEWCYIPTHKSYIRRKNLLHGVVLALRAYLLGESKLFVVPVEGVKNGGRPVNVGYRIPGEKKELI